MGIWFWRIVSYIQWSTLHPLEFGYLRVVGLEPSPLLGHLGGGTGLEAVLGGVVGHADHLGLLEVWARRHR